MKKGFFVATLFVWVLPFWGDVKFDASLNYLEREIIRRDLENLCTLVSSAPPSKGLVEMLRFRENADCDELKQWLYQRIGFLVKQPVERFVLLEDTLNGGERSRGRGVIHDFEREFLDPLAVNSSVYAYNIGILFNSKLLESNINPNAVSFLFIEHFGDSLSLLLPFSTGRIGLVELKDNFFLSSNHPNPSDIVALANSIHRLAILFHEARHSDGSLFFHKACPFNQRQNCDTVPDGPYGVSVEFLNYAISACDSCSMEELSRLEHSVEFYEELIIDRDEREIRTVNCRDYNTLLERVRVGETVILSDSLRRECRSPYNMKKYAKTYVVSLKEGQILEVSLESSFDNYLYISQQHRPYKVLARNDDGHRDNHNAHLTIKAARRGAVLIVVTSFNEMETGNYTLNVTLIDPFP